MRRQTLAIGLLVLGAWSFASPRASCVSGADITSAPNYVYSFDGECEDGHPCNGLSANVDWGAFWALGFGDPAIGQGFDNGSFLPPGRFLSFYTYGSYLYPSYINTSWTNPGVDGCINTLLAENDVCTAMVLASQPGPSTLGLALLAAPTTNTSVTTLAPADHGPIEMLPVGSELCYYDEPWPTATVLSPVVHPDSVHIDPACPTSGPIGYRIYVHRGEDPSDLTVPDPDPENWELALIDPGPDSEPIPMGESRMVIHACDPEGWSITTIFYGYRLVFDDGFETPWVTLFHGSIFPGCYGASYHGICCTDADGDAYCIDSPINDEPDCDDTDPAVSPWAEQVCDGVNNNCDAPNWPDLEGTNEFDDDGDGQTECAGDCDDGNPLRLAGNAETCDGFDNNCDGRSDESPGLIERVVDPSGTPDAHFGVSVSGIGDADGDEIEDFVVGSRWDTVDGLAEAGSVSIFSGATRGLIVKLTHPDPQAGDHFGIAVGATADIDNDGFPEIVVGADQDDTPAGSDAGSVHVFSTNPATGFRLQYTLTNPDAAADDRFGYALARLPDLTGDGWDEILVGARGDDADRGSASLFNSRDSSLIDKIVDPAGDTGDELGYAVAALADVDGDLLADFALGAMDADSSIAAEAGKVLVFSGATRTLLHTLEDPAGTTGDDLGRSVTSIADVDSDTVDDILVGAPSALSGAGRAALFSGASGGFLRYVTDEESGFDDWFGFRSIRLDDLDGDGADEFLVGSFRGDTAIAADAGSATVFSGASLAKIATLIDPAGAGGDFLGAGLAGISDLNGDGVGEILVGGYAHDTAQGENAGSVLLYAGALQQDLDGDGFGDACDADDDGDGVDDADDCSPRDASYFSAPGDVGPTLLWTGPATLAWNPTAQTETYNLYRGTFGEDAWAYDHACLEAGLATSSVSDASTPTEGGRYYLVTASNPCGEGPAGEDRPLSSCGDLVEATGQ